MYTLIFSVVIPFLVGYLVAVYGSERGWGLLRVFVIAIFFSAISGFVGAYLAKADTSVAMSKLRDVAVQVTGLECSGSGSIIQGASGKTFILTNAHVCNCAKYKGQIFVTFEGGELLKGDVVKQSWDYDLCAAEVKTTHKPLKLSKRLLPFTEVNTRGYPNMRLVESHGRTRDNVSWYATFPIGEVGACPRHSDTGYGFNGNLAACRLKFTSTRTSLFARPGSSGSAVVNDEGELVGVISSFLPDDDYDAGMVPYYQVKDFVLGL